RPRRQLGRHRDHPRGARRGPRLPRAPLPARGRPAQPAGAPARRGAARQGRGRAGQPPARGLPRGPRRGQGASILTPVYAPERQRSSSEESAVTEHTTETPPTTGAPPTTSYGGDGPSGPRAGFWRRFAGALIDGIVVGV